MDRFVGCVLAALAAVPLLHADQLLLDNGDRISGKVTKKDGDSVTIASDLMGAVTIKWAHVKSVTTDAPVTVVLSDGKTVQGKVETSGDQLEVGAQAAPLPSVTALRNEAEQAKHNRYLHPPLYDLWSGYYDFGIADTSGNSRSLSITNAVTATRITSNDKIAVYINEIYSKGVVGNVLGLTADAWHAAWSYDRNVSNRVFLTVFDNYDKDKFQNLTFRGVFGGGAGIHARKTKRTELDLVGGASLDHEAYSIPIAPPSLETSRNSGEVYWGDDLSFKLNNASSFKQSFRMFNNLSDTGQYRVNFDIGMVTKVAKWLSWQITASDRYITDPPPTRKTNDLLISSGIRLTFSQLPQ